MNTRLIVAVLAVLSSADCCWAQRYTRQGAVVGGATGAVIGGLIGKQSDKTTGGAIIGGAVGALAGGAIGNRYDTELARQRHAHQQALQAQRQYYTQQYIQPATGVTVADVLSMSRSGVSDAVIISQVQSRGIQRRLEVSDIISLHQQGISDAVLSAMQNARLAGHPAAGWSQTAPGQQPAVIVHEPAVILHESPSVPRDHRVYSTYPHGYIRGF